jgi:hypothetical protein
MRAHREIEVQWMELAELEGLETVDDDRLRGGRFRAVLLEEQQGMAAEPLGVRHDRRRGALLDSGDLAVARAGEQRVPGVAEKLGALKPVGGGKGL